MACGQFCVQGVDDGSDWWLHPLLPHAYCSVHWQVVSIMISMILNYLMSRLCWSQVGVSAIPFSEQQYLLPIADGWFQVYQHQQPPLLSQQCEAKTAGEVRKSTDKGQKQKTKRQKDKKTKKTKTKRPKIQKRQRQKTKKTKPQAEKAGEVLIPNIQSCAPFEKTDNPEIAWIIWLVCLRPNKEKPCGKTTNKSQ